MNMAIAFPSPVEAISPSHSYETPRLAEQLAEQNLITHAQREQVLVLQRQTGKKVGRLLVGARWLTENHLALDLARQLEIPFVNLKTYPFKADFVQRWPEVAAWRFRALVIDDLEDSLRLVLADPLDMFAFDELTRLLKRMMTISVAPDKQFTPTVDRLYRSTDEISGLARALEKDLGNAMDFCALSASVGIEGTPVVRLLQSIFEDAIQVGASDVHIEPQETQADQRMGAALAQRLKLMASLDISEKRLPKDGRFSVRLREHTTDVRLSTLATAYGESSVMRLRFKALLARSAGLVLVTGPTGSGKTTTFYAALSEINAQDLKIIMEEDPVECRLPGITQAQVSEKIDLSFARVLRSTLRQDPGVILVGEMRGAETTEIGLRAAVTGHLVRLNCKECLADDSAFIRAASESMKGSILAHHALALVSQGHTSVAEALRLGFDIEEQA
jgi:MSHA biogenesis protein MshE